VTAFVEPVLAAGKDELDDLYQGRSPKAGWREVLYYGPATVEVTQSRRWSLRSVARPERTSFFGLRRQWTTIKRVVSDS